jgi:hypothetical protein
MKMRSVTLFTGRKMSVPKGIQRIDSDSTHGWQVRYQGTKLFSDGSSDGSRAKLSLDLATRELARRMTTMPVPMVLKRGPSAHKKSKLPAGISGPILSPGRGERARSAVLSVLMPQYGKTAKVKSVYIGNENTYTKARFREALAKAVALRAEVLAKYEIDAAKGQRKEAKALLDGLKGGAAAAPVAKPTAKPTAKPAAKKAAKAAPKKAAAKTSAAKAKR